MVDGAALLTTAFHGLRATGAWQEGRGVNLVDGGSFYDTYETADGRYVAVGPLEPQFFTLLVGLLGVDVAAMPPYQDPQGWPAWKTLLGQEFKRRSRDEWVQLFEGTDACVAPVLSPWEAPLHPHNAARGTFVDVDGIRQPAPAPRFDRTPAGVPRPLRHHGRDCDAVLADWSVPEACAR